MKLYEVVAFDSEISKGVKFKKVGWQLATQNFTAKIGVFNYKILGRFWL